MFERAVLHLDLDAFFASVECLRNRDLCGKPLIIGGASARGVVASCSYEARRFGIHSAMPMKTALQRCPDAIVLRGDMGTYTRYSHLVTEIIGSEAPLFEKASIDEFYLDLTGMDRHIGCWRWAQQLRRKVMRESGLPISQALAINKLVSKVGTGEAKPQGARLIDPGMERAFLAPLPVRKLPAVGRATQQKLLLMGVRNIDTLSRIPPELLAREFGKPGIELWRKSRGIDERPVEPYQERKSLSTERTFQRDTTHVHWLRTQLGDMVSRLAYELRCQRQLTACITVKIRYTDFNTFTKQKRIPYTASDRVLRTHARELFDRLYQRRQLIRLVGVRFGELVHGQPQLNLFEDTPEEHQLQRAMDRIRGRFGGEALRMG